MPHLSPVEFDIKESTLVSLPFSDKGNEMLHERLRISINKRALVLGRQL